MESNDLDLSMTTYVSIEPPRLDRYRVELFGTNSSKTKVSERAVSTIIKKVRPLALSVPKLIFEAGVGEYALFSVNN
jgi:hypothetical protein